MMAFLYAGLIASILNITIIPIIIIIASRRGWFDTINARKIHTGQIPRLGGIGIFWSFALTLIFISLVSKGSAKDALTYWPVGAGMLMVHLIGLVDDFRDVRARYKLLVQIVAATLVVVAGYRFRTLFLPGLGEVSLGLLSYPLTMFWIVGVINAINMIDGMDGLSGGISIIGAFALGVILLEGGLRPATIAAIALVGSLAGSLF